MEYEACKEVLVCSEVPECYTKNCLLAECCKKCGVKGAHRPGRCGVCPGDGVGAGGGPEVMRVVVLVWCGVPCGVVVCGAGPWCGSGLAGCGVVWRVWH